MQVQQLSMVRSEARALYRRYKMHLNYSQPVDAEIRRAAQLLAQGRLIVRARESIIAAGLATDGLPRLAICRADAQRCDCNVYRDGAATMRIPGTNWPGPNRSFSNHLKFPAGTFDSRNEWATGQAAVPIIPAELRPRRGLENYFILWEATWQLVAPGDPYLLRRIGKSDLWLVVAQWDLTELERLVLNSRLANA